MMLVIKRTDLFILMKIVNNFIIVYEYFQENELVFNKTSLLFIWIEIASKIIL